MEKIEARILMVLQQSRRAHRENGRMTPEEIRDTIASQFGKLYRLQEVRDELAGFILLELIEEVPTSENSPVKYRITEKGCALVAVIKRYAETSSTSRFAELVRPSFSPNVRPSA